MLWYFEFLQTHIENLQARLPPSCLPINETGKSPLSSNQLLITVAFDVTYLVFENFESDYGWFVFLVCKQICIWM